MKELNTLIQEIVDFGDVIAYAEDSTDPNFQHACDLFSQYMDWRFNELKAKLDSEGLPGNSHWTPGDLESLTRMISTPRQTAEACINWTRELFQFSVELQRNKAIAA